MLFISCGITSLFHCVAVGNVEATSLLYEFRINLSSSSRFGTNSWPFGHIKSNNFWYKSMACLKYVLLYQSRQTTLSLLRFDSWLQSSFDSFARNFCAVDGEFKDGAASWSAFRAVSLRIMFGSDVDPRPTPHRVNTTTFEWEAVSWISWRKKGKMLSGSLRLQTHLIIVLGAPFSL